MGLPALTCCAPLATASRARVDRLSTRLPRDGVPEVIRPQSPSLPKPRQTVCGRVREIGHLRWCCDEACARWLGYEVVATRLLHGQRRPVVARSAS